MKYAFTYPDGSVGILIVASSKDQVEAMLGLGPRIEPDGTPRPGMTDEEYEAHILEGIPKDALDVNKLPDDWEPPENDRTFRAAWRQKGGRFSIDMDHARDVARTILRSRQTPIDDGLIEDAETPDDLRAIISA